MVLLFDTNLILIYLRNLPLIEAVESEYEPFSEENISIISVVTVGELKAISLRNKWGNKKIQKMNEFLLRFIITDINAEDVLNEYARIDAFSQGKLDGTPLKMSSRNMGKNDLWIAATASILDATLLTTDNDFDHLHEEFFEIGKIDITF